ncbi:MAG TPA: efflux RND transporter periplasmic adaptor subunit [Anaerolineaceae bacterium]
MEKKTRKSGKKWMFVVSIIIVAAGLVGGLAVPQLTASSASGTTTYQTAAITKGSISTTVSANGNVYPKQSVTVSWQTSGVVSQVSVTKGQQVASGTVIAQLDQSSLPQSVISAATDLAAAQKSLDDLLNSNTARANAELALLTTEQTLQDAQKTAQSKLYSRASQTTVDTAKANLIQAQNALDRAAAAYNTQKGKSSQDTAYAAALSQFAAAQQTYDEAQANYQYVQDLPSALAIQQANAAVDVAKAAYDDAKRAWERVKDGPNADDVAAAEAKVAAAQAVLDEAKISAPISGTITAINTQAGDLVSAGAAAVQIDDLSHMYVDIAVSEVDISSVKVGQSAEITFDALTNAAYTGKVTDIATEGTSSSGAVNYTVTVELDKPDAQIKPGMTATATITVTQKTGVLLVASSAVRTVSGQTVVYILQNGALQPVKVTTGDTSGTSTELTSTTLKEGDLVVTNPPSATSTTTKTSSSLFGGLFGGILGGGGGGGPRGGQPPSGGPNSSSSGGSSSFSSNSGRSTSGSSSSQPNGGG